MTVWRSAIVHQAFARFIQQGAFGFEQVGCMRADDFGQVFWLVVVDVLCRDVFRQGQAYTGELLIHRAGVKVLALRVGGE